jgi:hypothetical protein
VATWTAETILALAPDASSAKAGKELGNARKWVTLGATDVALWGECQGSGANPYQTQVDLSGPAFKCSCPSRKFPCKHGLGLFLLNESNSALFTQNDPPDWVKKWLESRTERTEKKAQAAETKTAPDPVAQAKRAAQREDKVSAGLDELERWLTDLVRTGLAETQAKPYRYWDGMAARLIDSQAPVLARHVGSLAAIPSSGQGWQERMLESIARIHVVTQAWKRIDALPPDAQADVRSTIGFTVNQTEIANMDGIRDRWQVSGVSLEEDEKLKVQRTWLTGKGTGRLALILEFAHSSQPLDTTLRTGMEVDAEIVYFPGSVPQRAIVKSRDVVESSTGLPSTSVSIQAASASHRAAVSANPWLERTAFTLAKCRLILDGERWFVQDDGGILPLPANYAEGWKLAAISGGHSVDIFGEWDGRYFRPLTAWTNGRAVAL